MLTTSNASEDIAHAASLRANSSVTKAVDDAVFVRRISASIVYRFEAVTLPPR